MKKYILFMKQFSVRHEILIVTAPLLTSVTNFIQLVSLQPVDWFSQTKLC